VRVFETVPYEFDRETYSRWIHLDRYGDREEELDQLLAETIPLVCPRFLVREVPVQHPVTGDEVVLEGRVFHSAVLAWNLERTDRAWAYAVTCGREIYDRLAREEDPLKQYWIDALAELALQYAADTMEKRLKEELLPPGEKGHLTYMNPGSADRDVWILEDQKPLFSLLGDVRGDIGVTLTEGCLMEPSKTLSGFYFFSEAGFVSCWVCSRTPCKTRRDRYRPEFNRDPSSHSN
jgi:hypothetical protein